MGQYNIAEGKIEMYNQGKTKAIAEIKESVQLSTWQREIEERQASKMSVDEWCNRLGISRNTYYYRLRRVREQLCENTGHLAEEQRVVPISTSVYGSSESKIEIMCGNLQVSFTGTVSSEALKTVIEVLQSC